MIMRFEMNLEMVASREGAGTMLALVSLVASVQFNMPISTPLVLEGSITIIAGVNGALVVVMMVMMMMVRIAIVV